MFSFFLQSCLILLGLHGFVHLGALTWYHIHGLLPHYLTVYYLLPFWRPETGGENGGGSNFFFIMAATAGTGLQRRGCYTSEGTSTCVELEATTILANREILGLHECVSEFPFR